MASKRQMSFPLTRGVPPHLGKEVEFSWTDHLGTIDVNRLKHTKRGYAVVMAGKSKLLRALCAAHWVYCLDASQVHLYHGKFTAAHIKLWKCVIPQIQTYRWKTSFLDTLGPSTDDTTSEPLSVHIIDYASMNAVYGEHIMAPIPYRTRMDKWLEAVCTCRRFYRVMWIILVDSADSIVKEWDVDYTIWTSRRIQTSTMAKLVRWPHRVEQLRACLRQVVRNGRVLVISMAAASTSVAHRFFQLDLQIPWSYKMAVHEKICLAIETHSSTLLTVVQLPLFAYFRPAYGIASLVLDYCFL